MHFITVNETSIPFDLKRNARSKSIKISVYKNGRILVSAPPNLSEIEILNFVREKIPWILKTLGAQKSPFTGAATPSFQGTKDPLADLKDGDTVRYLGTHYPLEIHRNPLRRSGQARFTGTAFVVEASPQASIRPLLTQWYKAEAQTVFTERVNHWAPLLKVHPQHICIRSQKTRWGSCSIRTKSLHFNWKVVMAPMEVIDYLVVHELCHLRFPNHSPSYWQLVQSVLPSYKLHRAWLKSNGETLNF